MAYGVDLGTTNSSVAWTDEQGGVHSLVVRTSMSAPFDSVVRSIVLDPCGDHVQIGNEAVTEGRRLRQQGIALPLLVSFKPRLDRQRLRKYRREIVRTPTGEYDPVSGGVRWSEELVKVASYDDYSRAEVVGAAANLLQHLLTRDVIVDDDGTPGARRVRAREDEPIFIGVPVPFGTRTRTRLLNALAETHLFGSSTDPETYHRVLKRCRFVYEPLALALAPMLFESTKMLVFDYGGGSLDLALLDVRLDAQGSRVVEQLALGGRPSAGDHLDRTFRESLLRDDARLADEYTDRLGDGSAYDRFEADNSFTLAKQELSQFESTILPAFPWRVVARSEFEEAVRKVIDDAADSVLKVLEQAELDFEDVGHVVMTGGSSLTPCVQEMLRGLFAHLGDGDFTAGTAGDPASEREALVGISRGLARFAFLDSFEARAPADYTMLVAGTAHEIVVLPAGSPDVFDVDASPPVTVPLGRLRPCSLALHSQLVRQRFVGAIADFDVPDGLESVVVRVAASRERFTPAFAIYHPDTGSLLKRFDLETLPPEQLAEFIETDRELLSASDRFHSAVLTRPLRVGDLVEFRGTHGYRQGVVLTIRDVARNVEVDEMEGLDPDPYMFRIAHDQEGKVRHDLLFDPILNCGEIRLL